MKEIKFRGWDKLQEVMGPPVTLAEICEKGPFDNHEVEVMEFAGIHDINGKEVYEGDIAVCRPALGEDIARERGKRYVVEYIAPYWMLTDKDGSFARGGNGWWESQVEIMGNIYENPEILQGV